MIRNLEVKGYLFGDRKLIISVIINVKLFEFNKLGLKFLDVF